MYPNYFTYIKLYVLLRTKSLEKDKKLSNEFVGGFYEKIQEINCLNPKSYFNNKSGGM